MTTAHLTRHQERKPMRGPVAFLLLTGIEYTDARPWIGFVGAAVTGLVGAAVLRGLS